MMRPKALTTTGLVNLVRVIQDGTTAIRAEATDDLLRRAQARMLSLSRKMLRGFPVVSRWFDPEDVVQQASLDLLQSLRKLSPPTTRDFFNLVAFHIRRQLLHLAKRLRGREKGLAANHDSVAGDSRAQPLLDPPDPHDPADLERWVAFHKAVERLPGELREVFGLAFYGNLTQKEIAAETGLSVRSVRRRLDDASVLLVQMLGDELPGG
jgi:RNA polymerase sigma-70 factor (ECF subfamily)